MGPTLPESRLGSGAGRGQNGNMATLHICRVGAWGQIGRFAAVDAARYPRDAQVIVRTARGLEIGQVLAWDQDTGSGAQADGPLLRGMTPQDELLQLRLNKNRNAAYEACCARLRELKLDVALMEVEHLFDGRTLIFYFLGDLPPELEQITGDLADAYDAKAQFRSFAETLTTGCGPDCGTAEAGAGACGSCGDCSVASACRPRRAG